MTKKILTYFNYLHLHPILQETSKGFSDLADQMENTLPEGDEKENCLRKLLEAKDCAVRAAMDDL